MCHGQGECGDSSGQNVFTNHNRIIGVVIAGVEMCLRSVIGLVVIAVVKMCLGTVIVCNSNG